LKEDSAWGLLTKRNSELVWYRIARIPTKGCSVAPLHQVLEGYFLWWYWIIRNHSVRYVCPPQLLLSISFKRSVIFSADYISEISPKHEITVSLLLINSNGLSGGLPTQRKKKKKKSPDFCPTVPSVRFSVRTETEKVGLLQKAAEGQRLKGSKLLDNMCK